MADAGSQNGGFRHIDTSPFVLSMKDRYNVYKRMKLGMPCP